MPKNNTVPVDSFLPWHNKVLEILKKKVYKVQSYINNTKEPSINSFKNTLSSLHDKFVVTTVDKASNNYAFICKKFFILVLLNELGFDNNFIPIGNMTYLPVPECEENIIQRHLSLLRDEFNITCHKDDRVLPKLFWVPKLHKNPFKFRFIAGAKHCTTKRLSVLLNQGLTVVKNNFIKYCNTFKKNSGYSFFWSIKSTFEFLNKIEALNVHSLQVFDFSTLYTNIDQSKILEHLNALLDLVFNSLPNSFKEQG